ncbi:MAG: choice-of-anchor Q domain-containing protein [Bacteroidota bacterium]
MSYSFEHCLIKTGQAIQTSGKHYENVIENKEPKFLSLNDYDFRLDTLSPAIDTGDVQTGKTYPKDILNNSRDADEAPDLGAYEYVPGAGKEDK